MYISKQIYGITVFGGLWGIPGTTMDEETRINTMTTKEDMRKMQVLHNSVMRIMSNERYDTPTTTLLQKTNQLSIHQLVAYHSGNQVYNINKNKFPKYHYRRLFGIEIEPENIETRSLTNQVSRIDFNSSLARGSFFFQASRMWNALPTSVKGSPNIDIFKKQSRAWVQGNVSVRP